MTSSTVTLTPGAIDAPGVGVPAEIGKAARAAAARNIDRHTTTGQALHRAATGDVPAWLGHVRAAAGCTRPIRLTGEIHTIDRATGAVLARRSTQDMPDGQIYVPCRNRRATVCPSCAETYRADTYQLFRAGLVGGKGIPSTVASHPAVFLTLTAPSFGYVHTRRSSTKTGKVLPCRPRRTTDTCPHGANLVCNQVHAEGEHALGQPYCLDCYDHHHQVVWNHHAGELWRRTTIALNRELARLAKRYGVNVRISYAKVAEFQARGVVHFHALIRLDGRNPADPDTVLPPHPDLTRQVLEEAIYRAAYSTTFTTDPHPAQPNGWRIAWGAQVVARPVHVSADGEVTDTMVAAYLAKYATKATESTGHISARLTHDTIDLYADETTHTGRLIAACWTLGATHRNRTDKAWWTGLRRWAHMLGFGGHFSTKSRRYSVTLRFLRDARIEYARQEIRAADHDEETTLIVGLLSYAATGWKTHGDAMLANTAADLARSRRLTAREELAHELGTRAPEPATT
ncbi:MAG: replication initiator [Micromonosporaceae bacterium]